MRALARTFSSIWKNFTTPSSFPSTSKTTICSGCRQCGPTSSYPTTTTTTTTTKMMQVIVQRNSWRSENARNERRLKIRDYKMTSLNFDMKFVPKCPTAESKLSTSNWTERKWGRSGLGNRFYCVFRIMPIGFLLPDQSHEWTLIEWHLNSGQNCLLFEWSDISCIRCLVIE